MKLDRIIALEGGRNFRDLGGYPAADGRRVKWRTLFRSGTLCQLTATAIETLDALSIRAAYDLRTADERRAEPHAWPRHPEIFLYSRDYTISGGELGRLFERGIPTAADARAAMIRVYRTLPYEQAEAYCQIFHDAATGKLPLLFNCSAGKDRTGVAAALLLAALGVDRDVIVEDYALSETLFDFRKAASENSDASPHRAMQRLPQDVQDAFIASHPDYLVAMFGELNERNGDLTRYLEDELAIGANEIEQLQNRLLE